MTGSSPPDEIKMSEQHIMTQQEEELSIANDGILPPSRPLNTMLRKETLEVYQTATSEVNDHVAKSVAHLRGETFSWAQACNHKIDVTANEVMNAVGRELTTSNRNLESRVDTTTQELRSSLDSMHTDTLTLFKKTDSTIENQRQQSKVLLERFNDLSVETERTHTAFEDEVELKFSDSNSELRKEILAAEKRSNERFRKLDASIGRLPDIQNKVDDISRQLDPIKSQVNEIDHRTEPLTEAYKELEAKLENRQPTGQETVSSQTSLIQALSTRIEQLEDPGHVQQMKEFSQRIEQLESQQTPNVEMHQQSPVSDTTPQAGQPLPPHPNAQLPSSLNRTGRRSGNHPQPQQPASTQHMYGYQPQPQQPAPNQHIYPDRYPYQYHNPAPDVSSHAYSYPQSTTTGSFSYLLPSGTLAIEDPPELIRRVKQFWPQALAFSDLPDHEARRPKNLGMPLASWSPSIARADDMDLMDKLSRIQMALRADMSPYSYWPLRIVHLFKGEFFGIARRIETLSPTWITLISWIGDKVGTLNRGYNYELRLSEFSSQVEPDDTPRDLITKLFTIAHNIPRDSMSNRGLITAIKSQLCRYLPHAHDRMVSQHSYEESEPDTWLESLMNLPNRGYHLGEVQQPRPLDVLQINKERNAIAGAPPQTLQTLNAIQNSSGTCFKCGKPGHWARDCKVSPAKFKSDFRKVIDKRNNKRRPEFRRRDRNSTYLIEEQPTTVPNDGDLDHQSEDEFLDELCEVADKYSSAYDDQIAQTTDEQVMTVHTTDADSPLLTPHDNREGAGPHCLYPGVIQSNEKKELSTPIPIFFDSGSGPSWIKQHIVKSLSLLSSPSPCPSHLSGIGRGSQLINEDARLKIGLKCKTETIWIELTAGVVPESVNLPSDLLIGRAVYEKLGIGHANNGTLRFHNVLNSPSIEPIVNLQAYPLSTLSTVDNPPELSFYAKEFPVTFGQQSPHADSLQDHGIQHIIDTETESPINLPVRTYSPRQAECLDEFVESALKKGIIRESKSPWSSPALLVAKKDGRYRVCIDYRSLNKVTKRNAHPLPNVNIQIQRAAGHKWYTSFDLADGFWQVRMNQNSIEKTAFSTHDGHFEWLVMPFGLTNAPATFEMVMRRICREHRAYTARLLDDILVFSDDRDMHDKQVRAVLTSLNSHGFVLQQRKCSWFQKSATFLGFIVSNNGISADSRKVQAISERPLPSTITELRSFLNASGYLRQFIAGFAEKATPLYDLTKGSPKPGTVIKLVEQHQEAFNSIKNAIISAPLLRPIQFGAPSVIDTDASLTCIGAVLQQAFRNADTGKNELHPVAYESHKLSDTQRNYSAQERELLAVVYALTTWRSWIEGTEIVVRTDHQSLSGLRSKAEIPPRVNRFLDLIEHFSPTIHYRKGKLNHLPDWLSRPPQPKPSSSAPADISLFPITTSEADITWTDVLRISDLFLNSNEDALSSAEKDVAHKTFMSIDDKLYKRKHRELVLVENDTEIIEQALNFHHRSGHCSAASVLQHLLRHFWHPSLILCAQEAIRRCTTCSLRLPHSAISQTLDPLPPVPPLARWGIDFSGPILLKGYRLVLLNAIDYATSWSYTVRCDTGTSVDVMNLLNTIILNHAAPREVISDNGAQFTSADVESFLRSHHIKHRKTTPYHPRTNGRCERYNGVIKQIITATEANYPQYSVDSIIDASTLLYRTRPLANGHSPFFLLYGCNPRNPTNDTAFPIYTCEEPEEKENERANILTLYWNEANGPNEIRQQVNSTKYTRNVIRAILAERQAFIKSFDTGDWVLRKRVKKHKLEPWSDGPYQIVKKLGNNVYQLQTIDGQLLKNKYNAEMLFPAYSFELQPVESPWYSSKRLLQSQRQDILDEAGIDATI